MGLAMYPPGLDFESRITYNIDKIYRALLYLTIQKRKLHGSNFAILRRDEEFL